MIATQVFVDYRIKYGVSYKRLDAELAEGDIGTRLDEGKSYWAVAHKQQAVYWFQYAKVQTSRRPCSIAILTSFDPRAAAWFSEVWGHATRVVLIKRAIEDQPYAIVVYDSTQPFIGETRVTVME